MMRFLKVTVKILISFFLSLASQYIFVGLLLGLFEKIMHMPFIPYCYYGMNLFIKEAFALAAKNDPAGVMMPAQGISPVMCGLPVNAPQFWIVLVVRMVLFVIFFIVFKKILNKVWK